ncbi:hypothetical protein CCHL11_06831 [Colletotrichum chlorophyti]|uniref:Uncharacterized protein n=1 Tax=Colletotrichum chlorophyti TaxID=708187 RepID=A0A1Q8S9B1_9PEZI|nr:hypothetical protein CCHL11_06831 [Colletotrichum chlorophyti]
MAIEVPNSLNWLSFVTGILSFGLTILNLIALYGNFVATIRSAPFQIRDSLGNLRQQLCEEREALRHQTREIRSKRKLRRRLSHVSDKLAGAEARRALDYAEKTLPLHYITLRELWRNFKELERPFLVTSGYRAEAILNGAAWAEADLDEKVRTDLEKHGEAGSFADWSALYKCDFAHRFIWWQVKDNVKKLSDEVMRIMARRTEREVTHTRMMVKQIFQGDGPPQPVEIYPRRPVGGGGGGGGAGSSGGAGRRMSSGPAPVRRSPVHARRSPVPLRRSPNFEKRVAAPVRERHDERYETDDEESSSYIRSSDDDSGTTRRNTDDRRQSDGSPLSSESRDDPARSDAATVGKSPQQSQQHPHSSKNRWEQFRARPERSYAIREYFERQLGQGHSRIVEVIPESEIGYYLHRPRQKDGEK